MRIACLGWGSLVWDPRELPVRGQWFEDGPFAPVEFARQSSDGRMTLVIDRHAIPIGVLWAQMLPVGLQDARQALRKRENSAAIGSWQRGEATPIDIPGLATWADVNGFDAIVWTALGPKFGGKDRSPSVKEVLEYLGGLSGQTRDLAKEVYRTGSSADRYGLSTRN